MKTNNRHALAWILTLTLPSAFFHSGSAIAGETFREYVVLRAKVDAAKIEAAVLGKDQSDPLSFDLDTLYRTAPTEDRLLIAIYMIVHDNLDGERASNFRTLVGSDSVAFRSLTANIDIQKLRTRVEAAGMDWTQFRRSLKHLLNLDLPREK